MHDVCLLTQLTLLALLAGCSGSPSDAVRTDAAAVKDKGASLYDANCAPCHQPDGRGLPRVYPSLVGSPVLLGDPEVLARWVIEGRRPASMPTGRFPTTMIAFGWMRALDAAMLFTFLRSHFGNTASAVDAATVVDGLAAGS